MKHEIKKIEAGNSDDQHLSSFIRLTIEKAKKKREEFEEYIKSRKEKREKG